MCFHSSDLREVNATQIKTDIIACLKIDWF